MKKRIICFLLAFCMLCLGIPYNVAAYETTQSSEDGSQQDREEWLEYLENQKVTFEAVTTPAAVEVAKLNQKAADKRYTVLVLDKSGSMSGEPMNAQKESARKFCKSVLEAGGENYVAVVSYGARATINSGFTNDYEQLVRAINGLYAYGGTNTTHGLEMADDLLQDISDESGTIKNVLLLSDGIPTEGTNYEEGRYTYQDYYYYRYANAAYDIAMKLQENEYKLYTLGFFHGLQGAELEFGRRFMNDLQNAGYYDVVDPDDLDFVFDEIANEITKKTGKFKYPGKKKVNDEVIIKDFTSVYFYDDSYFFKDSYEYNEHLATMSLCLELSAWASADVDEYDQKSTNAKNLLEELEFEDFESNDWYKVKPTRDSIGAVAANKKIKKAKEEYTLIALAVRGGGYESEWASNFTIGSTGTHKGFSEARDNVLAFLEEYIQSKAIEGPIKLWITGYSRAAATANLVAGAIDDGVTFENCTFDLSDVYAYTFETPAGALQQDVNDPKYDNIFNIINANDPVPKVAPHAWQFTRYGVTEHIPSNMTKGPREYKKNLAKMLEQYKALENTGDYQVDNFAMQRIDVDGWNILPGGDPFISIVEDTDNPLTQSTFLDEFITIIARDIIGDRQTYEENIQEGVRDLLGLFYGAEASKAEPFRKAIKERLMMPSNIIRIARPIMDPFKNDYQAYKEICKVIEELLQESLIEAGITEYTIEDLKNAVAVLANLLIDIIATSPNRATTLMRNIGGIGEAHYPELCLAWMQSMDSYYGEGGEVAFTNGGYRIIHINCPVDVNVYDEDNNLVASIIDNKPQDVGSTIISAVNEDGEKLIYLPVVEDYTIKAEATGTGTVAYTINEYNAEVGDIIRVINYPEMAIELGDEVLSVVPAYSEEDLENNRWGASSTEYEVYDADNERVEAQDDLAGAELADTYYKINVSTPDRAQGLVTGQGVRQLGQFAQVVATPSEGCQFDGWYVDGQLISEETTYRFRVSKDVNLVAEFKGDQYNLNLVAGEGGTLTQGESGEYEAKAIIQVTATPLAGYRFESWTASQEVVIEDAKSAQTSFIMPVGNVTLTANFTYVGGEPEETYELEVISTKGGTLTVDKSGKYKEGEQITIEVQPKRGYRFRGWTTSNGGTFIDEQALKTTFTMPGNATVVQADFKKLYYEEESNGPINIEEALKALSQSERERIQANFREYLPYTQLEVKLTLEQVKELTENLFTEQQLKELIDRPEVLEIIEVDINELITPVKLVPIKDANFSDVPEEHWAKASIQQAAELGLVTGRTDGTFDPSNPLEVVDSFVFLDRVLLLNDITKMKHPRSQVEDYILDKEHWGFENVASIEAKLSEETLKAVSTLNGEPISRELLAQVIYEITDGELALVKETVKFVDTIHSPYRTSIDYCIKTGILNGVSEEKMMPEKTLTRAELMMVLIRLNEAFQ